MTHNKQWINSEEFQVSYLRMYKSGSSTICKYLGNLRQETKPKYRQFTVIRDPYERAVSIYSEMVKIHKLKDTFTGYITHLYFSSAGFKDKHQLPQAYWLENLDIKLFKLSELDKVAAWIGSGKPFSHLNKRNSNIELTQQNRKMIEIIYRKDIILFESI